MVTTRLCKILHKYIVCLVVVVVVVNLTHSQAEIHKCIGGITDTFPHLADFKIRSMALCIYEMLMGRSSVQKL